ncbi:alpha/beta hydrolase [Aquisphaera insulae]|uniref:alpha/beta hydrolase n=1 Tax=Aquisphaera insulae TaxID=2712864 RepID=UPI0013EB9728|nr:alpha/beta hydrolase family protein [Aquisphaera insulae]
MAFARINYFSRSLEKASSFTVVFPDDPAVPRPWSAFYLLHGLSDDDTIWARRTNIDRYVEGLPLMVVMPDGGRGWYSNAAIGPAYEDDLVKDVVGLVDRTFPVKADRAGRAIGGLSMGGYGAVKVGLKHHETFGSISSHSGAVGICQVDYHRDDRLKGIAVELDRIFGPNPKGGQDDPFAIVEKIDHGRVPPMRLDCGKDDFLLGQNRDFHAHLDAMRIPHEYQEFPGDHNWPYWDLHVQEALAFHVRNLQIRK